MYRSRCCYCDCTFWSISMMWSGAVCTICCVVIAICLSSVSTNGLGHCRMCLVFFLCFLSNLSEFWWNLDSIVMCCDMTDIISVSELMSFIHIFANSLPICSKSDLITSTCLWMVLNCCKSLVCWNCGRSLLTPSLSYWASVFPMLYLSALCCVITYMSKVCWMTSGKS